MFSEVDDANHWVLQHILLMVILLNVILKIQHLCFQPCYITRRDAVSLYGVCQCPTEHVRCSYACGSIVCAQHLCLYTGGNQLPCQLLLRAYVM